MKIRCARPGSSPIFLVILAFCLGSAGIARAGASPNDEEALTPPPAAEADGKGDIAAPADHGSPAGPDEGAAVGPRFVTVPPPAQGSWIYQPRYGFQMSAFLATHPTDTYMGVLLAGHVNLGPYLSLSADLRLGGGNDDDGDQYVSSLITLGGSVYWWFRGGQVGRALQPYARLGAGYLWMPDERFDDGTDDDDDWDKRRNYKMNGASAPGHSDTTFSEAVGLRFVLLPTSGEVEVGASFDVELSLYQDMHYGMADSGLMITLGLSMFY